MIYTFDGTTKRITLPSGAVVLDLVDLHSRWKEWVLLGNAGFAQAFSTIGGETPKIPLYLFLSNGWKIVPQSANHVLSVTNGILETDDASEPFVDPVGSYSIRINRESPGIAIGYSTSGTAGPSAESIAAATVAAMMAQAQITPIHADARSNNGAPIIGDGSDLDPWRGVGVSP